jgi:hypothetical protein
MKIRLTQFSIDLDYTEESLLRAVGQTLRLGVADILSCVVTRRSIDARVRRGTAQFTLRIDVEVADGSGESMWR